MGILVLGLIYRRRMAHERVGGDVIQNKDGVYSEPGRAVHRVPSMRSGSTWSQQDEGANWQSRADAMC